MKPNDHRFRVGLTLTAFTVLAFGLVFSLDTAASWWSDQRTFKVVFPFVQGLRPNDPVQFHGVPCGRVVHIAIRSNGAVADPRTAYAESRADDESQQGCAVELTLQVPGHIFSHLRTESGARIEKTLTGVTVVNLEQGRGAALTEGAEIVGTPAVTIDDVTGELQVAAAHLTAILAEFEPIVRTLNEDGVITSAVASVDEAGHEAAALALSIRELVHENSESIREVATGAANLIDSLDSTIPAIREFVGSAQSVSTEAKALAASLRHWVRDARGSVDASLENIERASSNLKSLSGELERRPWRLLHAPTELEARELGLYDSVSAFSDGALELRRSIDTVRRLLESDLDVETEAVLRKALEGLERDSHAYRGMQRQFWQKLQKLYED